VILSKLAGFLSGTVIVATGMCFALPAAAASPLAAHRAVYDISLKSAEDRTGISGAKGRMVIEFSGSGCEGWTVNFRMINQFFLSGGKSRILDSRSSMWESGESDQLRYVQRQFVDSKLQEEKELRAKLAEGKSGGSGAITKPKEEIFSLPEGVTFPVDHQLKIVKAAEAGESRDETLLYDGSDGSKPAIAITFIGSKREAGEDQTDAKMKDVNGLSGWPVSISYFKPDKQDKETPEYQVSMVLYENGVSGDMSLNYGDFVLDAKLTDIKLLEMTACN
jgi:hypothetical protein